MQPLHLSSENPVSKPAFAKNSNSRRYAEGEYTGAGGLSVDGMARILGAAAGGMELQVLHSHRVGINLMESTPPKVDKLWLDNIVRAEAFMGLERVWDPIAGENNRGHMGDKGAPGDRIDNHKDYRPAVGLCRLNQVDL
jgi:hypothetical protein